VPIYKNAELVRLLARMDLGQDPDAPMVEKDVTERGDDY
jgi:flagellar biosynthesis protein